MPADGRIDLLQNSFLTACYCGILRNVKYSNKKSGKSFQNLKAVDDVSIEVQEGEVYGIVGPDGLEKQH